MMVDFGFETGHSLGAGRLECGLGLVRQSFEHVSDGTPILIAAPTGDVDATLSARMHPGPEVPGALRLVGDQSADRHASLEPAFGPGHPSDFLLACFLAQSLPAGIGKHHGA